MLRAGLVGPEQRLQGDDDYVCVSLPKKRMFGSDRRIAKIRFRDLSTKRSKNTRRAGPQRLDCCAKPSGHAPSPSFWGWVRHAHSVRMTVPGPNFISHMPGTDPSMVRLQRSSAANTVTSCHPINGLLCRPSLLKPLVDPAYRPRGRGQGDFGRQGAGCPCSKAASRRAGRNCAEAAGRTARP